MPTIYPDVYVTEECRDRVEAQIAAITAEGTLTSSEAYEAILIAGLDALDAAKDSAVKAAAAAAAIAAAKAEGQS